MGCPWTKLDELAVSCALEYIPWCRCPYAVGPCQTSPLLLPSSLSNGSIVVPIVHLRCGCVQTKLRAVSLSQHQVLPTLISQQNWGFPAAELAYPPDTRSFHDSAGGDDTQTKPRSVTRPGSTVSCITSRASD